MALLKKTILALLISFTMFATAPSVMAEIELTETLADAIKSAEATLAALQNGEDKEAILTLFKKTKQISKAIVISGPADIPRTRANSTMKKARKALKDGDNAKAIELATKGVALYKQAEDKHFK